jgi:hypothetical protein
VAGAPPAQVLDQVPAGVRAMSGGQLRDAVAVGLCVGQVSADDDAWYPLHEAATDETREAARAACDGCRVRWECLELAVRTREVNGFWGGLVSDDRKRIVQSRAQSEPAGLVRSA